MVEVHENPAVALSDGAQTLYPDQFQQLMVGLKAVAQAVGRTI
jgi:3-deoxy-7-phosphoheptulonate synthase